MARTPLASRLERLAADAVLSRRQLLGAAAASTAALAAARMPGALAADAPPPGAKVVVVGAGLAGLLAGYRLQQAGVDVTVHEADPARVGGRCWSLRGTFAEGQVAERGGELIDTGHTTMRQLIRELGLQSDNLLQAEANGTEALYYFDGRPYTVAEAEVDFNGVYQKLHRDLSDASYPTTYRISTARGRQLDAMTITQWIEESVPGGNASRLGQLLATAYEIEFGAPCDQQSALNIVYLLGYAGQGQLSLFGASDEKHHVRGGNDQVTAAMAAPLKRAGRLFLGSRLTAIRRTAAGAYTLTFLQGSTSRSVTADRVVLALPFSILRSSVDLIQAGFDALKLRAIRELPMGSSTKINVGFRSRHWRTLGNNGDTYGDTGFQNTWEVSRGQPGTSGVLVDYLGGGPATAATGTPVQLAKRFLAQLEPVLPGITSRWDGRVAVDRWIANPLSLGSYSYYRPGQYTAFGGVESEISGACHFAGEHTTQDYQGYLEGAVVTGQRAADEVLAALRR